MKCHIMRNLSTQSDQGPILSTAIPCAFIFLLILTLNLNFTNSYDKTRSLVQISKLSAHKIAFFSYRCVLCVQKNHFIKMVRLTMHTTCFG